MATKPQKLCYDDWETETVSSLIPRLHSVRTSLRITHEQKSQCCGKGLRLDGYLMLLITGASLIHIMV